MAADARANKLTIHPFTVRVDKLPKYAKDGDQLYDIIYNQAGAEGVFTDFPDLGVKFLQNKLNNLYFYYPALINKGQIISLELLCYSHRVL